MKMQMKIIQTLQEDIEPYENLKKLIDSELLRLDSQIDLLEQIADLMYEFGIDAETFQSSRVEQYRKNKDSVPEEFAEMFLSIINLGAKLASEDIRSSVKIVVKNLKNTYRRLLEIKLEMEDIEE